jgi:cytochrome P450
MADQPAPVDDVGLTGHAAAIDWLHGQPYAEWAAARGSECPVVGHASEFPGHETSYQILRYKDAETVLRDPETFSSSINAEQIGQFMGDLILAMGGTEHRMYRNLVA